MLATQTPQESVNAARPRPATCDIVIVILWSRMGTPLPDNLRKANGEPYLSGTEWEYEDAVNSPQRPRPAVLVYRRIEKLKLEIDDPDFDDKRAQFRRVEAFFARFRNADGSLAGGVNEYAGRATSRACCASTWRTFCIGACSLPAITANLHRRPPRSRPSITTGCGAASRRSSCWGRRKAVPSLSITSTCRR
jgi:hypothetical protein